MNFDYADEPLQHRDQPRWVQTDLCSPHASRRIRPAAADLWHRMAEAAA